MRNSIQWEMQYNEWEIQNNDKFKTMTNSKQWQIQNNEKSNTMRNSIQWEFQYNAKFNKMRNKKKENDLFI